MRGHSPALPLPTCLPPAPLLFPSPCPSPEHDSRRCRRPAEHDAVEFRAPRPDRSPPEGLPHRSFQSCRRNRRVKASRGAAARFHPRLRLRLGARFRGDCRGLRPPGRELAPTPVPRRRPLFSRRGPSAGTPSPGRAAPPSPRAGRHMPASTHRLRPPRLRRAQVHAKGELLAPSSLFPLPPFASSRPRRAPTEHAHRRPCVVTAPVVP